MTHRFLLPALMLLGSITINAKQIALYEIDKDGVIKETVSGASYQVKGVHPAEAIAGAKGKALRLDGYSTYVDAKIGDILADGSKKMTASIWFAIETYPIVELDVNTSEQIAIASCINEPSKTGFGFFLGFDGKYSFKTYVGGWPLEMKVDTPLPQYEWINLTAVIDAEAKVATLYHNGTAVATSKANGTLKLENSDLRIGRSFNERFIGPFCISSFNGLIDDISVWDEAIEPSEIHSWQPDNVADLSIPASRFADDPLRPAFHGMPGANWTNETHGMAYSNNRYHVFFQKNANGPYMARLHWGHISSENLFDWREESIAITPGAYYDIKGCWSGCVFTDDQLTQGKPSIIYTGVDYAKAVIAQANPLDENLISWEKGSMPIINGRPSGLSDDFRDPYFFRNGDNAYIIVGTSAKNVGATTLHAYNPSSKTWSNDGKLFFSGTNVAECGTFWEMPNITKIGDKWLFTTTPQNTSKGVACLYWVGKVNADGTFSPDKTTPATVELPGFARDGYGLLSPTILQHDGKTIALGIVPDKLSGQDNYNLGYAHTYSLPREWTLDSEGNLWQKPYSGLAAMRGSNGFSKSDFTLNGDLKIEGVAGRAVELCGEFVIGPGKCGFNLLDNGTDALKIYYDGAMNEIVIDARGNSRLVNDAGVFDGYYHSTLPQQLAKGETIKLNIFFDHSILDIFINDRWASSVRVFAHEKSSENTSVFTEGEMMVKSLKGWNLDVTNGSGVDSVWAGHHEFKVFSLDGNVIYDNVPVPSIISIYDISGMKICERKADSPSGSIDLDRKGIHLVAVNDGNTTKVKKIML